MTVSAATSAATSAGGTAVVFNNVSIVFGERPDRALPLMDAGHDRAHIQRETAQVLGVHDCSLAVPEGEILVLMGLSGSGKSTLLRAVNALNPVARGAVTIRAGDWTCDVTHADADDLRRVRRECVSMVFQQFGLLPWRTVAQNVGFGLELAGMAKAARREKVAQQLDLVGLSDWADRRVGDLSGGMQQRVGLARAFANDAPILLMDEPFSALDPLIRTRLQDELVDLQRRLGRTIVFVSHDLDEAFKIGDRIAIMEGGRIVQHGTPADIFRSPATDYVANFVAHMNPLGVLTAADVMDRSMAPCESEVAARTPVSRVIATMAQDDAPLAVMNGSTRIGRVTRGSLLAALAGDRT